MKLIEKKAFSLIELIIAMFVFFMGIISVYGIINTTIRLNNYNKDYIIAANLAREQIELIRNIRDTNFAKIQSYNIKDPSKDYSPENIFEFGKYYKIENDFSSESDFSVKVDLASDFKEDREKLSENEDFRLCLDENNLYVYCSDNFDLKKTIFYKYIKIEEIPAYSGAFEVVSNVVWNINGYHKFEIKSILTDYKIF